MDVLYAMSGALPPDTPDSTSEIFVDIGYDSGSEIGIDTYEAPFSNYWNTLKRSKNSCCQNKLVDRFSSEPVDDHVYDINITITPPISPSSSSTSKLSSLKQHSRKISENSIRRLSNLSIFQRRRGSNKTNPTIDTQTSPAGTTSTTYSHKDECDSDLETSVLCNCFLERYVEYSSYGRSIDLPPDISPAVTELEELARQQHVVRMKKHRSARSESEVMTRIERYRRARRIKEDYEEQQIEEKYAKHIEMQRQKQKEASNVQDGFSRWYSKSPYEELVGRLAHPRSTDSIDARLGPTDVKLVVSDGNLDLVRVRNASPQGEWEHGYHAVMVKSVE